MKCLVDNIVILQQQAKAVGLGEEWDDVKTNVFPCQSNVW